MNKKEFEEKCGPIEAVYRIIDFTELKNFLCSLDSLPSYTGDSDLTITLIEDINDYILDIEVKGCYHIQFNMKYHTYDGLKVDENCVISYEDVCYAAEIMENRQGIIEMARGQLNKQTLNQ